MRKSNLQKTADSLDLLAVSLELSPREKAIAELHVRGMGRIDIAKKVGLKHDNYQSAHTMVSRFLNKPNVQTYVVQLKTISKEVALANLPKAPTNTLDVLHALTSRQAALDAVQRHGWAKVVRKTYKDSKGNITGSEHTRSVDGAMAARTLIEDARAQESAKLAAKATMGAAAIKQLGEILEAEGVDLAALAQQALFAAEGDDGDVIEVEATPEDHFPPD